MLSRSFFQLVTPQFRSSISNVLIWRASINTLGSQMAKKQAEPPATSATAPAKGKTETKKTTKGGGETYMSGEMFYSYNAYSFYDIENEMEKDRILQPSSRQESKPATK